MMGWVEPDGSYGVGAMLTFPPDALTEEQWTTLMELHDSDRYEYVCRILEEKE